MKRLLNLRLARPAFRIALVLLGVSCSDTRAQTCSPPPSSLVGWWRGEGDATDQAGGNNGSLIGNTTFGAGEVCQAFVMGGNGDAVSLGNPVSLQLQDVTIEFWLKRSSPTVASMAGSAAELFCYGTGGYGGGRFTRRMVQFLNVEAYH